VAVELEEQLLAQERELESREGAIVMWEEGLVAFTRALREVRTKCDASHAHVNAFQRDFFSQAHASGSQSK
jgi:hypothetical protein